jgi:hypothetical protein
VCPVAVAVGVWPPQRPGTGGGPVGCISGPVGWGYRVTLHLAADRLCGKAKRSPSTVISLVVRVATPGG